MKTLLATPIHECKDYCMEAWLKNVSELLKISPVDILFVDNSPSMEYVQKVKSYCKKFHITNYEIKHIECEQGMKLLQKCTRIETSQQFIRKYILDNGYDVWFSWECDQIIPADSLEKLSTLMSSGNFMVVAHNAWTRGSSVLYNMDMGITLINRDALEKHKWQGNGEEDLFKERVFQDGGNYVNAYGLLNPVYHLDDKHYLDEEL